jgi:16S rRNA G527 N7-methylase RsmG
MSLNPIQKSLLGKPNKEMNPTTAAALTTALVRSNMIDAILVRAHANCKSISDFTSHCIEKKGGSIRVKF